MSLMNTSWDGTKYTRVSRTGAQEWSGDTRENVEKVIGIC